MEEGVGQEQIAAFGEQLARQLPGSEVYICVSVRDLRARRIGGQRFKVSVLADLREARLGLCAQPVAGAGWARRKGLEEYSSIVEWLGGPKALNVPLTEVLVVYSTEYGGLCDELEQVNQDAWQASVYSSKMGPVVRGMASRRGKECSGQVLCHCCGQGSCVEQDRCSRVLSCGTDGNPGCEHAAMEE